MGRVYDIADRISQGNQKPMIKIDNNFECKVNTGKSIMLKLEAIQQEKGESVEALDDIIALTLGKEAFDYIESLDLPIHLYETIVKVILAAFEDKPLEEVEAAEEEKK